jgi:hypothetical protein
MYNMVDENMLMMIFKRVSSVSKAEILSRAFLVEKIETGIKRQYGLDQPPKGAA